MPAVTPERRESLAVVLRWQAEGGQHLDQIVGELSGPSGRRGFVQNLSYGVIRNLRVLDLWIEYLSNERKKPDPRTEAVLRIGLFELMRSDTAAHAAVNEAVSLAGRAGGFVNALLRRASRERDKLEELASHAPMAVQFSHPDFLVDRWVHAFGAEKAAALCAWDQEIPPVYVRLNRLRGAEGEILSEMGHPLEGEEGFWNMECLPKEALTAGMVYAQDPSTALACRLLDPKPGQRVLDACASPGGKTALLAQMMDGRGEIVATDSKVSRLDRLTTNLDRLGVTIAEIHAFEWGQSGEKKEPDKTEEVFESGFDRILVDVPCSNTGVLRRRVDARWKIQERDFARQAGHQLNILTDLAKFLRPGGRLVYSTCSIDREENQEVIEAFFAEMDDSWVFEEERVSFPLDSGFDGAYAAALTRVGAGQVLNHAR